MTKIEEWKAKVALKKAGMKTSDWLDKRPVIADSDPRQVRQEESLEQGEGNEHCIS
jgi:hypothetical protein